jgi:opacity protein-like surface antigen
VNIGTITWANFAAAFDFQYVLAPGAVVQPYAGVGLALVIRDGDGAAIQGTFVEDALDTFTAGLTASAGIEVRVTRSLYLLADGRGLLSSELRTLSARGGVKIMIPRSAP